MQHVLKKHDDLQQDLQQCPVSPVPSYGNVFNPLDEAPTPIILRTNTISEEVIHLPPTSSLPEEPAQSPDHGSPSPSRSPAPRSRFRPSLHIRKRSKSTQNDALASPTESSGNLSPVSAEQGSRHRSLSGRFKRLSLTSRSRASSSGSVNVPEDLPEIPTMPNSTSPDVQDTELEWEKRAAMLAQHQRNRTPSSQSIPVISPSASSSRPTSPGLDGSTQRPPSLPQPSLTPAELDNKIQEAIALHESGDLARSTAIFRTLADPEGPNNAFSQTLYGLALQNGWGCTADPPLALHYHTLAASNSASITFPTLSEKSQADSSTTSRSARTAARGELVLAIFELGNAFRHGLGCAPDPIAARKYYETAAELGDVDAMVEAAWCYEHGFGGAKDKWMAARFLRMAEARGVKIVGNSWIWKDKYVAERVAEGSGEAKKGWRDRRREKGG